MRHVSLTCKNHPDLRWSCKEIATNLDGSYNGARNIFFFGHYQHGYWLEPERVNLAEECKCPPTDLTWAPEELERQKTEPLTA